MAKKIEKLDIVLEIPTEDEYEKAKNKYISEYEEWEDGYSTGLFGYKPSKYVKRPDIGKAKWDDMYPKGYYSWVSGTMPRLNGYGMKNLIDKTNEIAEYVNVLLEHLVPEKKKSEKTKKRAVKKSN